MQKMVDFAALHLAHTLDAHFTAAVHTSIPEFLHTNPVFQENYPENRRYLEEQINRCISMNLPIRFLDSVAIPKGNRTLSWLITPVNEQGQLYIIGSGRDITEEQTNQLDTEQFFLVCPDLFCMVTTDGWFLKASPAWTNQLGWLESELLSQPLLWFIHPEDSLRTMDEMKKILYGNVVQDFQNRFRTKSGGYRWLSWNGAVPKNGIIYAAARDIEEHKQLQDQLIILSETDSLTRIANRFKIARVLEQELERAARYLRTVSVILFDIDHFKDINDTLGHNSGDNYLQQIAEIVQQELRPSDFFGRWGGDEFLIILPETDLPQAAAAAERIRGKVVGSNCIPRKLCSISAGVSCWDSSIQPRSSFTCLQADLIKAADVALYKAKTAGRNAVDTAEIGEHE